MSTLDRVRRFWNGEGRCLANLTAGAFRPRQDTPMAVRVGLCRQALAIQAGLPGPWQPSFFPDFGTISMPRYWGGKVTAAPDSGLTYVEPVAQSIEQALALVPAAVDDPRLDVAQAVWIYRQLTAEGLWLRTPDMQGALNTAGRILQQEELFMAMVTDPALVHQFLEKVGSFLIEVWQYLRRQTNNQVAGSIWPYTIVPPDCGVVLTEDLMPLLSADLYREFGIPQLRRIQAALGPLHIHCCGQYRHQVASLKASGLNIRALEFHYPFTTPEDLEPLAATTVFVPYLSGDKQTRFKSMLEFYRYLIAETPYRYWFACLEETPETMAFVREIAGP